MSIASRHGKLHAITGDDDGWHRRTEDLLTADVFGAYRYLPPEAGLIPLLCGAVDADGATLESWAAARDLAWAELAGHAPT